MTGGIKCHRDIEQRTEGGEVMQTLNVIQRVQIEKTTKQQTSTCKISVLEALERLKKLQNG